MQYARHSARESRATVGSGRLRERCISAPCAARLRIAGPFCVELEVDPSLSDDVLLRFRADDNVLPRLQARLRAGVLEIGLADGMYSELSELHLHARVGPIAELSTLGRALVRVHGLCGHEVALHAAHASVIKASGSARHWQLVAAGQSLLRTQLQGAEQVQARVSEASTLQLEGDCAALELAAQGAAHVLAARPAFQACCAQVALSGAARVSLCARERVSGRVQFPARLSLACRGIVALQAFTVVVRSPSASPTRPGGDS